MKKDSTDIGVLFFSRSASAEAGNKIFAADNHHRKNTRLARQLITQSRKQVIKTALPYIIFDEQLQQGNTFGERFANAFLTMFELGYDHVIAVGNDTPELHSDHIKQAADQLQTGQADIVLGPAKDGGTWLTAFSKSAFEAQIFEYQPWQENQLLSSLLQSFGSRFTISKLESLADIDDARTLQHFVRRVSHQLYAFVSLLQSILAALPFLRINAFRSSLSFFYYQNHLLRAPPLG
ncbi:TIGR04282 family arsenosugar biosynthesis glycosyltransferase [Fodinibius halophilus]|uniref:DUF2064 domain-containing protein n=1 Tax=Fodinibius halophilus TaxID=1736908 RepID=A0A6M1TF68_9BACT|nr:DUF2064 domain-containing protein [Fodinibius halophilus]NGP88812.1 DUF2064 domain-containing protein [Fodinibius halophilus]